MLIQFMKIIVCLLAMLATIPLFAAEPSSAPAGNSRIIKWVDEKGVTHYGDRLPPQFSGRNNTEMNAQGVQVKRNRPSESKPAAAKSELSLQERQDRALLAAYTSSDEIDLARDRSLQMDLAAIDALSQQKINIQTRLNTNNKIVDNLNKRRKPIPDDLAQEQKANQEELAKVKEQITERNASMEATQQKFDQQKKRFVELKSASAVTEVKN